MSRQDLQRSDCDWGLAAWGDAGGLGRHTKTGQRDKVNGVAEIGSTSVSTTCW